MKTKFTFLCCLLRWQLRQSFPRRGHVGICHMNMIIFLPIKDTIQEWTSIV